MILGSVLNKIVVAEDSSFSTIFSLSVNYSVAWALLITHFVKFYFEDDKHEGKKINKTN